MTNYFKKVNDDISIAEKIRYPCNSKNKKRFGSSTSSIHSALQLEENESQDDEITQHMLAPGLTTKSNIINAKENEFVMILAG